MIAREIIILEQGGRAPIRDYRIGVNDVHRSSNRVKVHGLRMLPIVVDPTAMKYFAPAQRVASCVLVMGQGHFGRKNVDLDAQNHDAPGRVVVHEKEPARGVLLLKAGMLPVNVDIGRAEQRSLEYPHVVSALRQHGLQYSWFASDDAACNVWVQ